MISTLTVLSLYKMKVALLVVATTTNNVCTSGSNCSVNFSYINVYVIGHSPLGLFRTNVKKQ